MVMNFNGCTIELFTTLESNLCRDLPIMEICDNGIDDGGDGLIDCSDPDCTPVEGDFTIEIHKCFLWRFSRW